MSRLFPGTDDNAFTVDISSLATLQHTNITVSFWFKLSAFNGYPFYLGPNMTPHGFTYHDGREAQIQASQAVANAIGQGGAYTVTASATTTIAANTWYHFAGRCGGQGTDVRVQAYINGTITDGEQGFAATVVFAFSPNFLTIGAAGWQYPFVLHNAVTGKLADFALWDAFLSSTEIEDLASGTRPDIVRTANLRGWYKLEAGTASTEPNAYGDFPAAVMVGSVADGEDNPPYVVPDAVLAADAGMFTFSGEDAAFHLGRTLAADYALFSLSGQAAMLTSTHAVPVPVGRTMRIMPDSDITG